jgi:hypothetical protein
MFYVTALSESCNYKPLELMWEMTLPQFLDEREFVEVRNAIQEAQMKDDELERRSQK